LTYALPTDMDYAPLRNKARNFVEPTLDSTQAAAQSAIVMNAIIGANNTTSASPTIALPAGDQSWILVALLDAPATNPYSIASFSYLLIYKERSTNIDSLEKAQALAQFVNWAITDGQQYTSTVQDAPLLESVVQHNQLTLQSLTFNGHNQYLNRSSECRNKPLIIFTSFLF
jgi:phosphate transport system substrate-binding protein